MKLILVFLLSISTLLSAKEIVGNVVLVDGNVKIKSKGSIKKRKAKIGLTIYSGDLISSSKASHLKLKLIDNSILILDELSTLHFNTLKSAEQLSGKVLYKITSRDAKNSLHVKTPFAVIGIKGTTFIVNAIETEQSVRLKEGLIGIASINEKFALYRKKVDAAFKKFQEEQDGVYKEQLQDKLTAFEKFKRGESNSDNKEQQPEITKEFDLEAGNSVSFDGNSVHESEFDANALDEFEYFEKLLAQEE